MRRGSTVEQLYADALELAERGKSLALQSTSKQEAATCFNESIRIFNRLAIVESAAKRELIKGIVADLKQQIAALQELSADEMVSKAMELHAQARDVEEQGDTAQCIELYLSAGDWYMKAYGAFEPQAASAKDAVREQIEYVIDHVSKLKEAQVAAQAAAVTPAIDVEAIAWPTAPEGPPVLTTVIPEAPLPSVINRASIQVNKDSVIPTDAFAWPEPPMVAPVLQSGVSQESQSSEASANVLADHMRWPLPPGAEQALDAFDWPMPPLPVAPQPIKRRNSRQSLPPSRTSSNERLLQPIAVPVPPFPPTPVRDESTTYSPAELDVLRRSSQINGHIFVPWLDDLDSQENFRSVNFFVDPDGTIPLSSKQVRKGAKWMRPSEFAQLCAELPVMIESICPQVVKQDIVTDCSFVASLCIAAAYEQRFQKRLITNIIFPVDPRTRQPMYNPSGKYIVKLWANGVPRKVVIDDLLPVDPQNRELLCSCTTRKNELWVSLIEKAYLKLCGGYDYPGGNSGIDLFALTGWIPERIAITDLVSDKAREDRIWEQLKSAFNFGDCIITMTTGDISKDQVKTIGLVPMHVYAVLNVYETTVLDEVSGENKKLRLLHVKNPWRKLSWRGPYSKTDTATWQGPIGDQLRSYQSQHYSLDTTPINDAADDGLFWIDLESVKEHYESLYLNWNPELFPHKYVIHEHWPLELGPANDSITLGYNPQYSLRFTRRRSDSVTSSASSVTNVSTRSSSSVWVLLTRHVSTVERDTDNTQQQFLTLHVYRNTDGRRVFYNQDAMYRGTYSNNPHTLVSLDVDFTDDDPEPTFTLVASQYEKFAPLDYTLSVFSTTPFECRVVPHLDATPHAVTIQGEWDATTAGGRPFYGTFMENPQYHVQVPTASVERVKIFLEVLPESSNAHAPVNLRVITHSRDRACGLPATFAESSLRILSSGEYRPGFCFVELEVAEMKVSMLTTLDLVLIPSTFEPATLAKFQLRLVSEPATAPLVWRPLAPEGFGMEKTVLTGRWDLQLGTAVGCASYGCYTFNPKYLVHVAEETVMFVRLAPLRPSGGDNILNSTNAPPLPSCNVSVFASTSDGALLLSTNPKSAFRRATSDEGAYASGNPSGVVSPKDRAFPAGWYVIVPSTYDPVEADFELRIYSTKRVIVRPVGA